LTFDSVEKVVSPDINGSFSGGAVEELVGGAPRDWVHSFLQYFERDLQLWAVPSDRIPVVPGYRLAREAPSSL